MKHNQRSIEKLTVESTSMAASPIGNQTPTDAINRRNTSTGDSSHFQKTVTLQEWWLIKSDSVHQGKRLGVAGFASSDQRGLREFHSAPVIRRYDMFTLETADAVTVLIQGFINRTRTLENGFPPQIFDHFWLGFPLYWELCGKRWCEVATNSEVDLEKTSADPCTSTHNIDMDSTAAVCTPVADSGKSDVEVTEDDSHIQSRKFNNIKASKNSILRSPVVKLRSSTSEEVNDENYSSLKGTLESPVHENQVHVSSAANDKFSEDVCQHSSRDSPSSSKIHTTSSSSLQDVVAEEEASSRYNVDSTEGIENLETIKRSEKKSISKSNSTVPVLNHCASREDSVNERDSMGHPNVSEFDQKTGSGSTVLQNKKFHNPSANFLQVVTDKEVSSSYNVDSSEGIENFETIDRHEKRSVSMSNTKVSLVFGIAASNCSALGNDSINERDNVGHLNASKFDLRMASESGVKRNKKVHRTSPSSLQDAVADKEASPNYNIDSSERIEKLETIKRREKRSIGKVPVLNRCASGEDSVNERDNMGHPNVLKLDKKTASGSTVKRNKKFHRTSASSLLDVVAHQEVSSSINVGSSETIEKLETIKRRERSSISKSNSKVPVLSRSTSAEESVNERDNMGHPNVSKLDKKNASGSTVKRNKRLPLGSTKPLDKGNLGGTMHPTPPLTTKVKTRRSGLETPRRITKSPQMGNVSKVTDGGRGAKKAKKRINFETPVSPNTVERRASSCLRSPESLNLKRSRSGRLLMPTLDFWRNQTPVYDADRKVLGIMEEVDTVQPRRGSKSEPHKKRRAC